MTISYTTLATRLARKAGDKNAITVGSVWDATDLAQTVEEAVQEARRYWYVPISPNTTYTGASSIAENTAEIAVPSAFLPVVVTEQVSPAGFISAIQIRETGSLTYTEPIYARWQFLSEGVMIDPLTVTTPKIRFNNPYNTIFEMRLYGGAPIVIPANPTTAIPGTDLDGLVAYLLEAAAARLFEMRETGADKDERGYRTRRLLAEQRAKEIKAAEKMVWPEMTAFSWT